MHSWVDWLDPHEADLDYTERSNSICNLTSRSACTFIDKASLRTASCSPTCADDGLIKVVRAHALLTWMQIATIATVVTTKN